jgi:hypothetical protein
MFNKKFYFVPVYEETPAAEDPNKGKEDKKFTQQELNDLIAREKGVIQKKFEKRILELEELKKTANLSAEQVATLNQQIDEMQSTFKTKEQLAQEETQKLKKTLDEKLVKSEQEREKWQNKYSDMVITNQIISAAVKFEAFDPEQIIAILKPNTKLVNKIDADGKKLDELVPTVKFTGLNEEQKEIHLDIAPEEAVKRMSGMTKYANLFKSDAAGGIGGKPVDNVDLSNIKDTKTYLAQRNKLKGKK